MNDINSKENNRLKKFQDFVYADLALSAELASRKKPKVTELFKSRSTSYAGQYAGIALDTAIGAANILLHGSFWSPESASIGGYASAPIVDKVFLSGLYNCANLQPNYREDSVSCISDLARNVVEMVVVANSLGEESALKMVKTHRFNLGKPWCYTITDLTSVEADSLKKVFLDKIISLNTDADSNFNAVLSSYVKEFNIKNNLDQVNFSQKDVDDGILDWMRSAVGENKMFNLFLSDTPKAVMSAFQEKMGGTQDDIYFLKWGERHPDALANRRLRESTHPNKFAKPQDATHPKGNP